MVQGNSTLNASDHASYFSVSVIKHRGLGNLEKRDFVWDDGTREVRVYNGRTEAGRLVLEAESSHLELQQETEQIQSGPLHSQSHLL